MSEDELDMPFSDVAPEIGAIYRARWSDPKANQAELLRRIDAALTELKAREESLRTGPEAVERAQAAEQALMIQDPQQARLWARYYAESQSILLRSSRELRVLQDRAAEEESAEAKSTPQAPAAEAVSAAPEAAEPVPQDDLPNDPGAPTEETLVAAGSSTSDPTFGKDSETLSRSMQQAMVHGYGKSAPKEWPRGAPR